MDLHPSHLIIRELGLVKRYRFHQVGFWINRITIVALPATVLGFMAAGAQFDPYPLFSIVLTWSGFIFNERAFRTNLPHLHHFQTDPRRVIAQLLKPKRVRFLRAWFPPPYVKAAYTAALFRDFIQADLIIGTFLNKPEGDLAADVVSLKAFLLIMQGDPEAGFACLEADPVQDIGRRVLRRRRCIRALALVQLQRADSAEQEALSAALRHGDFHFYLIAAFGLHQFHLQRGEPQADEYAGVFSGIGRPFHGVQPHALPANPVNALG